MRKLHINSVAVLLLTSVLLLAGCDGDGTKETDTSGTVDTSDGTGVIIPDGGGDIPMTEEEKALAEKFGAMSYVDEKTRAITLITREYLDNFWLNEHKKGVKHSFSVEEINYIIKDSIRIYREYSVIIMPEFILLSDGATADNDFPHLYGERMENLGQINDRHEDVEKIHTIIEYRLRALSSPDAFVKGTGTEWRNSTVYIPDYSESTDRDAIVKYFSRESDGEELGTDIYIISPHGTKTLEHLYADGTSTRIFPYDGLHSEGLQLMDKDGVVHHMGITLYPRSGSFMMQMKLASSSFDYGSYVYKNGMLFLYGKYGGDSLYVFTKTSDGEFEYVAYASNVLPSGDILKDKMTFTPTFTGEIPETADVTLPLDEKIETSAPTGYYLITFEEEYMLKSICDYNDNSLWGDTPTSECMNGEWSFTVDGYNVNICSCGSITVHLTGDVPRSRYLTDDEMSAVMRVLKIHNENAK